MHGMYSAKLLRGYLDLLLKKNCFRLGWVDMKNIVQRSQMWTLWVQDSIHATYCSSVEEFEPIQLSVISILQVERYKVSSI